VPQLDGKTIGYVVTLLLASLVSWRICLRDQVQHLSRDRQAAGHDMRIYDFAQGGSTLDDVLEQSEAMSKLLRDRVVDLDADKAVLGMSCLAK